MMPTVCALLLALQSLQGPAQQAAEAAPAWDAARAEHFWNRAGFGANTATLSRSLQLGLEAQVDELLNVETWIEEPFYARKRADGDLGKYVRSLPPDEQARRKSELRNEDKAQVDDFLDWWVTRMLEGNEALRERMVLFWHGHFTSSQQAVKSSFEMIQQNQLFRRKGLGSFRELLHGVARDPAMLVYLDNSSSKKSHPNENFARELLELYTLGEGHYSEEDVREVARAFTGWGQRNGRFHFTASRHDRGKKRVLGVEGRLDGDDVIEILLKQEACSRHVARSLLAYFEGREPEVERLESYALGLRESGYRIDAFMRRLLLDPEFYREGVRGNRVASPIDFLVGCARRVGVDPDPRLCVTGASLLGQRLFFPPSVRGWEGGQSWATGTSLLLRGELAGMLLGVVSGRDLLVGMRSSSQEMDGDDPSPMEGPRPRVSPDLRALGKMRVRPPLNLTQRLDRTGEAGDAELARALLDELLAVPAPKELVGRLEERLVSVRDEQGLGLEPLSTRPELAEPLLRELAHFVLSLPEAQLD